ncbi:helix-turn-helix domain-containing protein [Evansella sp. AB-rgal1]|uniref:helix-turn-helix domain-containing protein n=1 Tax=Evansella sp. AB-rgal1 TaxID=3242696 RepID=UPI00359D82A0
MKSTKNYPYEVKKQIVEMYFEGHSVTDLVEQFEVRDRRRIYDWIEKAREEGYRALEDGRGLRSTGKKKKEEQSLEEEYEKLKLENEYLKKLLDLKRG